MQTIEQLKKRRQLNVQEQNVLLKHSIAQEARYWRSQNIPAALTTFLQSKNIEIESSIFMDYDRHALGCSTDEGCILTKDGTFFKFDIDLSDDDTEIICINTWENITESIELSAHKKGTGATRGFLALEVLHELNVLADSLTT
jgi:hypothetical protein